MTRKPPREAHVDTLPAKVMKGTAECSEEIEAKLAAVIQIAGGLGPVSPERTNSCLFGRSGSSFLCWLSGLSVLLFSRA